MQFSANVGRRLIEALNGDVTERMYLERRAVKLNPQEKEIRVDNRILNSYIVACDKMVRAITLGLQAARDNEALKAESIGMRLKLAEYEFLISIFWYVLLENDLEKADWGAVKFFEQVP